MKTESLLFALAVAAAWPAASAHAQTIYRCGNEYTRIPCANGRALDASDMRSAAQRAEARAAVAQERRQAADMERDRRRNEAMLKPALATSLSPVHAAAPAASAAAKKPVSKKKARKASVAGEPDFIAGVPGSSKKKAKASGA